MKLTLFFILFFLASPLMAQTEIGSVRAFVAVGPELRPTRGSDGIFKDQMMSNYSLGVGYKKMIFILEKAQFEEASGNSTMNVTRNYENTMLWMLLRTHKLKFFTPFVSGGIGAYKEKVETVLFGASVENQTGDRFLGGASVGVSLDIPIVWLSIEGRMLFGDEIDPQPTLGGLARIGIWF